MTQMDSGSISHSHSTRASTSSSSTSSSTAIMANGSQAPRLNQQYNWYYDKSELKRTPSILDGISYEKERIYRNEGARFILNVGSQMKLRYDTLATGVIYFHRFYMQHSFKVFPRYVTAACCLFLAGKAEETPKKCRDIIKIAQALLSDQEFAAFGEDPREEVLTFERIILQTIRFDLQVEHPYKYLVSYAKCFKGNKDMIQNVLQMAWTFTNDSLCTTICLQWESEIVAIAMIFLASKIRYEITDWEGRLPHQKHWWDMFVEDLSLELLEDICHQVLDLYSKPNEEANRLSHSPLPSTNIVGLKTSAGNVSTNSSTTPVKSATQQLPQFKPTLVPSAPVGVVVQPTSKLTSQTATVSLPPPPPPPTVPPPPLPPVPPPHMGAPQWDPNLASFYQAKYNFSSLVALSSATPPVGIPPHLVPMPPHPVALAPTLAVRLPPGQPPVPPPHIPPLSFVSTTTQRK